MGNNLEEHLSRIEKEMDEEISKMCEKCLITKRMSNIDCSREDVSCTCSCHDIKNL